VHFAGKGEGGEGGRGVRWAILCIVLSVQSVVAASAPFDRGMALRCARPGGARSASHGNIRVYVGSGCSCHIVFVIAWVRLQHLGKYALTWFYFFCTDIGAKHCCSSLSLPIDVRSPGFSQITGRRVLLVQIPTVCFCRLYGPMVHLFVPKLRKAICSHPI